MPNYIYKFIVSVILLRPLSILTLIILSLLNLTKTNQTTHLPTGCSATNHASAMQLHDGAPLRCTRYAAQNNAQAMSHPQVFVCQLQLQTCENTVISHLSPHPTLQTQDEDQETPTSMRDSPMKNIDESHCVGRSGGCPETGKSDACSQTGLRGH